MTAWGAPSTWGDIDTWFTAADNPVWAYYLQSPVREVGPLSRDPYAELVRNRRGYTVVKRGGQWLTVRNPRQDYLDGCTKVFRGGYENQVTLSEKAELEAAGYTVVRVAVPGTPATESPDTWGAIDFWSEWGVW